MTKTMTEQDLKKIGTAITKFKKEKRLTNEEFGRLINVSRGSVQSMQKGGFVNVKYYIDAAEIVKEYI